MPLQTRNQKAKEGEMEPDNEPDAKRELTTEEKLDKLIKNSESVLNLQSELTKLTDSVKTLTADITSLRTNTEGIPRIETTLAGLQTSITTLTIESATNTIDIKESKVRISTLQEENVALKSELDDLKSHIR